MAPKILLTGGSGFLGSALLNHPSFYGAVTIGRTPPAQSKNFLAISLDPFSDYSHILSGIDIVVHVAARVHVMNEEAEDSLSEYRNINTLGTLNLAEQAINSGVKRFIFISSIKVLGEQTEKGQPFTNGNLLNPQDAYSMSKAEAETGLLKLAKESNMEVVIIRPPLVYGKGVKGNFEKLLKLTTRQFPLPLGSINNKRSLVSIENLVDLICICLEHLKAGNQTFLVSDDCDLSTPALLTLIARGGGYKSRLVKFPTVLLSIILFCIGKSAIYQRLCGSMQVDIAHTKNQLNWSPPHTPESTIVNCWSHEI